jgi:hypothetical protein
LLAVPKVAFTSLPQTRNELKVEEDSVEKEDDMKHYNFYTEELTSTLAAQRCLNGGQNCGFYSGKETTQPIIHDSEIFDPISFFKGLPGQLGAEIWSAMTQYIDEFVRVTWMVYITFLLVI